MATASKEKGPIMDKKFIQTAVQLGEVQILSAMDELFNHVDEGLPMWAGDGDRLVRMPIQFVRQFADLPSITLGLAGIDAAHDQNLRFSLHAADVTPTGFTIEFATWADTHIARASVSWQAVGKSTPPLPRKAPGRS